MPDLRYTAALGLFAIGADKLIHSGEVGVVFADAAAFDQVVSTPERKNEEQEQGREAVNRFFVIPIFVLLSTAIPWNGWRELGWNCVLLPMAVLLLRRPLAILLLWPLLAGEHLMADALFTG